MYKTKSLRFILSIFVILITIVTSGCLFFITSYIHLQSNKNNLKDLLNEQAIREASLLNYKLNFSGKTAVNIADMIETMPIYNEKTIFDKVSQKLTNDPLLFGMGVWFEPYVFSKEQKYYGPYMYRDNNNKNIFSWIYNTPEYDYFSWDWYQVVFSSKKRDVYFSNLFYDGTMNTYFMTGTAPIMKNNRFIGVATADISLREVAQYVNKIRVGYQGYAFILTNNGYIIGTPPTLNRSAHTKNTDLADYDINRISTVLEEKNKEYQFLENYVIRSDTSGLLELKENKEIAYHTNIGTTGLKLILIYPQRELFGSFYNTLKYYVILFIFSMLAIPMLLILVIKKLVDQPMSRLLHKVNKIIQGDFSKDDSLDSVINSNNEFGILGNSILKMSESLDDLVTNLNAQNTKIRNMAYYDVLTGLPNRLYFSEVVHHLIDSYGENDKFAVFFIDLDNFKIINDTYGHSTGDEVLIVIARRISALTWEKIFASRFGGDEFILIIKNVAGKEELNTISQEIHRIINSPIYLGESIFYVNVSIGISIYPDDAPDLTELLKNADTAMFKGKEEGRGRSKFFHKRMNEMVLERSELENKLRIGLANEEFRLYYQPLYDVKTAKIIGFEALLRWMTPDMGLVLPDKFIKHIEDTRFIIPLGNWVIRAACQFVRKLLDMNYSGFSVSVNVSVIQLMDEDFVSVIMDAVKDANIPAQSIRLEITESKLMESHDLCIQNILKLKMQGIQFAIDDFGTGYSSLNYLNQLPVSAIKIDKSFISDLSCENSNNLTEVIIIIAHKMGLNVVAEGVETPEQFELLKSFGCNIIQGYIISKPLSEEKTLKLLQEKHQ